MKKSVSAEVIKSANLSPGQAAKIGKKNNNALYQRSQVVITKCANGVP